VNQEKIEQAIGACYDAILAPEGWPQALHALARALDAAAMVFYPANPTSGTGDASDPSRPLDKMPMSPEYVDVVEEYVRGKWSCWSTTWRPTRSAESFQSTTTSICASGSWATP
jgi:hypothetical protein